MYFWPLTRNEIPSIWTIDRREVIEKIYVFRDGTLTLIPHHFEAQGWPPHEEEQYTPLLEACFDRGGSFLGSFEEERLIGIAVVDTRPLGPQGDLLQLMFFHMSYESRGKGYGRALFSRAKAVARARGAKGFYISATPTERTINFYTKRGAVPTATPDPELFALEPEDIHLECRWD